MTVIYPLDESIPTHARPHKTLGNTTARTVCAGAVMRDDICRSDAGNLRPERAMLPLSTAVSTRQSSLPLPHRAAQP